MLKSIRAAALGTVLMTTTSLANPYAEYEGTTLVVNFPAHPHYNAVMQILPEFTAQTGIEVEVEVDQLPHLKMRERQTLENLAKYFMNPKLADPSYDADDLIDGYV